MSSMTKKPAIASLNIILMKSIYFFLFLPFLLFPQTKTTELPQLSISENHRFLVSADNEPFFWLGDTAWLLFSKLSREEANLYLDDRLAKGYNVIQVMVLHSLDVKNYYGDAALVDSNISLPLTVAGSEFENEAEYDFWDHVDYIIDLAEQKGLYMALVPVWGTNFNNGAISLEDAKFYAKWVSDRYKEKSNIIWLNGGDTKGNENLEKWNAMGTIYKENNPDKLVTFHPFGRMKSSTWFHNEDWLDFNMFQSGHRRYDQEDPEFGYGQDNYKYVNDDFKLKPLKPTIDGEPAYESIPQGLHDPSEPFWTADDVRRYAYWSVFAGGFGFTYGHNAVMQMHKPGDKSPAYGAREFWTEALNADGANQMQYLKKLMLSKPILDRVPDQQLLVGNEGRKYDYQIATRGKDYAFIYTYNGKDIKVRMGVIVGEKINASWYNPRNGEYNFIGTFTYIGTKTFDPPGSSKDGNDWILVLEQLK
ncbi:collagenase-like protein with putative collagen-binding domain [Maribacter sp. MAR_2009_72]|nr:collagenase-like protein with putative collagen-binding domain [Maribacter sp. MAR_2009_72]